ncbi:uncharacterized protein [Macrobrachium rosenbergii]|uniref:uncharacterized protein n=1 Tax=Macrobrachium rosenbergii TaxID=79674 RepID=UPI0034D4865C
MNILKSLAKNKDITITRPDKGKRVVILNKDDYITKVETVLNDNTKFQKLGTPEFSTLFKIEDRINQFLKSLKDRGIISENTYQSLYSPGSSYGSMYGLPKAHKDTVPIRPILASYNNANYKLSKYLVPIFAPLVENSYSLKNSYEFKNTILAQDSELVMVSYDVESLFTNVPVQQTIDIVLPKLFLMDESGFNGFCKGDFKKRLDLAVWNTVFVFNGRSYSQSDGMAVGSPLLRRYLHVLAGRAHA